MSADPGLLAAVDIGSNSFRLEIGRVRRGRYRRHAYLKETVRLGAGLDAQGCLTPQSIEAGLACLGRFADELRRWAPVHVRAVATQTLREAVNREVFLQQAHQALGFPVEVISGTEEARLIYAGVAQLDRGDDTRLVVDIGGRSTELIVGQGTRAWHAASFPVGSVGVSVGFFNDGRLTGEAFEAAQAAAQACLESARRDFAWQPGWTALGASGTVGAVSKMLARLGWTDGRITGPALEALQGACIQAGHVDAIGLPIGLRDDRRPVLPGGLAVLQAVLNVLGIGEMLPAKGALRQGVIVELHARCHTTFINGP